MRTTKIDNPNTQAEGLCNGLPYTTDLANINGVHIHFWVGDSPMGVSIPDALHKARNAHDIVSATWSFGAPKGFWAHQDIE